MKVVKFIPYIFSITALILAFIWSGCHDDCGGFKEEPTVGAQFTSEQAFSRVYGVKDIIEPIPQQGNSFYNLPVNLNENTTLYLFESTNKTDTLELSYEVDVSFESKRCGFTAVLRGLAVGTKTTFDTVQIETSSQITIE